MTKEERQLLLVDLAARLPYKVKVCLYEKETCILMGIDGYEVYLDVDSDSFRIESIKPYLRPMSSMTEEEKIQLSQYACIGEDLNGEFIDEVQRKDCAAYIDWLNAHYFDYRNLIGKGLALEAPEGMYNIKEK